MTKGKVKQCYPFIMHNKFEPNWLEYSFFYADKKLRQTQGKYVNSTQIDSACEPDIKTNELFLDHCTIKLLLPKFKHFNF